MIFEKDYTEKKDVLESCYFFNAMYTAGEFYDGDKSALYMLSCGKVEYWNRKDVENMIAEFLSCIYNQNLESYINLSLEDEENINDSIKILRILLKFWEE